MAKRKYNPEIDLLKFFFSVIIVIYHSKKLYPAEGHSVLSFAFTGVEIFFMISGFLMAKSSTKYDVTCIGKSTMDFLIGKIKPIYPYLFFAFVVSFIVRQLSFFIDHGQTVTDLFKDAVLAVNEAFLLLEIGIDFGEVYNGPAWYISSMLIAMAILFPILLKLKNWFLNIGALIVPLFCYIIIYQGRGTLNSVSCIEFMPIGIIRAIAGLCLGCFIYNLVERLQTSDIRLKKPGKVFLWFGEVALIALLLVIMQFEGENSFDFISVVIVFFICFIVLSGLTGIKDVLPPKISSFLGRFSLWIYLNHRYIARLINLYDKEMPYAQAMAIYLCGSVIMAFVCELVVTLCKNIWKKASPKIKSVIFE